MLTQYGYHMDTTWFPGGHYNLFHVDSMWFSSGHHAISTRTPCGFHVDTTWLPCGHHMVSKWTPHGFHVETRSRLDLLLEYTSKNYLSLKACKFLNNGLIFIPESFGKLLVFFISLSFPCHSPSFPVIPMDRNDGVIPISVKSHFKVM